MTRDVHLLSRDDIRQELARLNLTAAATHYPDEQGRCPVCRRSAPGCQVWGSAVRALRAQGWQIAAVEPHPPTQPGWWCRTCIRPWPCGQARVMLGDRYQQDREGLRAHMAAQQDLAARDIDVPAVDLQLRFVDWIVL